MIKIILCIAGTIRDNRVIELNDNVEDHASNNILLHEQIVCTSGTIRDNRVIELDGEIIGQNSGNTVSVCQERFAEWQSRYRSR